MSRDSRAQRFLAGKGVGFRMIRSGSGPDIFKAGKGAPKFRERHPLLYAKLVRMRRSERLASDGQVSRDMFNYADDI